ncbi:MAG: hypothetical protein U0736_02205 [Gemmataceae bacterium]
MSVAAAQDADDLRRLYRPPETVMDYWNGLKFELDVGRPDLAAVYLRGLTVKNPTDKDLLAIVDRDGLTPVLRLRTVRQWTRQEKENAQALKDADALVSRVTAAHRARLADPVRLRELVAHLLGKPDEPATREERAYALRELDRSGAEAVPYLVEAYLQRTEPRDRQILVDTLKALGADTLAPLLAALDAASEPLKLDVLGVLRTSFTRYSREIVPYLWYLSAARTQPATVRAKATQMLSDFLETDASRLPPAKVALAREAEKFRDHKVTFGNPTAVPIWRWDGTKLVQGWPGAKTVTASQAEEYYGLRYARQALDLDPAYRPAQEVFLALAVEKATDRSGPGNPLAKASPQTAELLARSSPELVIDVLDRAMRERRSGVVLAAVRSLADRAEVRSKRPLTKGEPVLVQALYYPDPRVQLAAAEGLLRMPGEPAPKTAARIVEVLANALSPAAAYLPGRKVLVAISEKEWRNEVREIILAAGIQPVVASNDRDALREVRKSREIEAIVLASTLQGGLAHTLAQLRQDVDVARVPVLLAAIPDTPTSRAAMSRFWQLKDRLTAVQQEIRPLRTALEKLAREEDKERHTLEQELLLNRRMSSVDRENELRRVKEKYDRFRAELQQKDEYRLAARLLPDEARLNGLLDQERERYDLEARIRESALERFVRGYDNVQVVSSRLLTDSRALEQALLTQVKEAGVALTPAEKRQAAERAIELLAALAEGNPPGYDVRPAWGRILDAIRAGTLSPEGQLSGIRAARLFFGPDTQTALARVVLDDARPANVRTAAVRSLIFNLQRQGVLLSPADLRTLRELPAKPGLDATVKEQVDNLLGALQPSDLSTGQRFRTFDPAPVPMPAPPAKK